MISGLVGDFFVNVYEGDALSFLSVATSSRTAMANITVHRGIYPESEHIPQEGGWQRKLS